MNYNNKIFIWRVSFCGSFKTIVLWTQSEPSVNSYWKLESRNFSLLRDRPLSIQQQYDVFLTFRVSYVVSNIYVYIKVSTVVSILNFVFWRNVGNNFEDKKGFLKNKILVCEKPNESCRLRVTATVSRRGRGRHKKLIKQQRRWTRPRVAATAIVYGGHRMRFVVDGPA